MINKNQLIMQKIFFLAILITCITIGYLFPVDRHATKFFENYPTAVTSMRDTVDDDYTIVKHYLYYKPSASFSSKSVALEQVQQEEILAQYGI